MLEKRLEEILRNSKKKTTGKIDWRLTKLLESLVTIYNYYKSSLHFYLF